MGWRSGSTEVSLQGGSGSTPTLTDARPALEVRAQRATLVSHAAWERIAAELDPFVDRPKVVRCDGQAAAFEPLQDEASYSVDTGNCNYVTAYQRSLTDVRAGERLDVRLGHFELSAPEPAQAHVAVMLDGDSLRRRVLDRQVGRAMHPHPWRRAMRLLAPAPATASATRTTFTTV